VPGRHRIEDGVHGRCRRLPGRHCHSERTPPGVGDPRLGRFLRRQRGPAGLRLQPGSGERLNLGGKTAGTRTPTRRRRLINRSSFGARSGAGPLLYVLRSTLRSGHRFEHASAIAGLLATFAAVTLGIGTVAATALAPRSTPRANPSERAARLSASKRAVFRAAPRSVTQGPRPGVPAHAYPPPPLAFDVTGPAAAPRLKLRSPGSVMLVDLDTHAVLWHKNEGDLRATASLAKVFTVMVAMDHATLDTWVRVPRGGEDDDPYDSVVGLKVGDVISVRQLIEGVWLASGDDAA